MISCTEFIPAYSQMFIYLEEKYGKEEVHKFWANHFNPLSDRHPGNKHPLLVATEKEGIRGCYTYWSKSLSEEASDFTLYLNENRGYYMMEMHHCPSKGRLLEYQEKTGLVPYPDYCLHCDYYRLSLDKTGLQYTINFAHENKAACQIIVTDPKVFDGRVIVDGDTVIMDRRASQNEYFHQSFHCSTNSCINFLGCKGGEEDVRSFLAQYTRNVHKKLIEDIHKNGLNALADRWKEIYQKEKCPEALKTTLDDKGLTIEVNYCPGVHYLTSSGVVVSPWYRYTKDVVLETIAQECGLNFKIEKHNTQNGAACYRIEAANN